MQRFVKNISSSQLIKSLAKIQNLTRKETELNKGNYATVVSSTRKERKNQLNFRTKKTVLAESN
jgi:hypothetical protein